MEMFDFMDSAFKAGYPYILEIEVRVRNKVDSLEYRSYKDCVYAYRDASRKLGQVFDDYKDEKDRDVKAFGTIWRCSQGPIFVKHDVICTLGSFEKGSRRNIVRDGEVQTLR